MIYDKRFMPYKILIDATRKIVSTINCATRAWVKFIRKPKNV